MQTVIGLLGENGAGKGTFAELLKEIAVGKSVSRVSSGETLARAAEILHVPRTRSNLQKLAMILDDGFGAGTVTHAVFEEININNSDIVIFDGVRLPTDAAMIRSFPRNFLVYITARPEIRYERMKTRKEKIGEEHMTLAQFREEEHAHTEIYISEIAKQATTFLNNKSTEMLKTKIRHFYNLMNLKTV